MDTTTQCKSNANATHQAATEHAQAPTCTQGNNRKPQQLHLPKPARARIQHADSPPHKKCHRMSTTKHTGPHGKKQHIDNLSSCHLVTMVTTCTHRQIPWNNPEPKTTSTPNPNPPDPNEQSHHSPQSQPWQHAVRPTNAPQPPSRQHPHPRHTMLCKCNAPPNLLACQTLRPQLPIKI